MLFVMVMVMSLVRATEPKMIVFEISNAKKFSVIIKRCTKAKCYYPDVRALFCLDTICSPL